ncbi:MAG: hypothetical protein ACREC0_03450 [Methylocella sp.]
MTDLFAAAHLEKDAPHPLADRLRPESLANVAGQDQLPGRNMACLTDALRRRQDRRISN